MKRRTLKKIVPLRLRCYYHDLRFGFLKYFLKREILSTASIITGNSHDDAEICSLTSHEDFLLLVFCLKTLFYFSKRRFNVTVHDDGSLTEKDCQILKTHLKNVRLVRRKQADKKLKKILENKEFCQKYRERNPLILKLLDIPLLAERERVVLLDSDLIFFKKPCFFINWIEKNQSIPFYLEDRQNAYVISLKELERDLHLRIIPKFNTGLFGFSPKKILKLERVEQYLKYLDNKPKKISWWSKWLEQTIWALLVSSVMAKPLPSEYSISRKRKRLSSLTCRHYISPVRELFYLDAWYFMRKKFEKSFQKGWHVK